MISGLRKPIPSNQHKPAKRLPKGIAMTLGIGFKCPSAIVLCADTLITYEDSHKAYEHKIYQHVEERVSVLATYCGFPNTMTNFVSKFENQLQQFLHQTPIVTAFGIQNVIESILKSSELGDDFWLLCGVCIPDRELQLIKAWGQRVGMCSTLWDCIGWGDSSLIKYLGSLMAQSVEGYSPRQAEVLGLYLLREAILWVDGVGGEIDAFTLHSDGRIVPSPRNGFSVGLHFTILEKLFSPVAEAFFDERISDGDMDSRLETFIQRLKEARRLL